MHLQRKNRFKILAKLFCFIFVSAVYQLCSQEMKNTFDLLRHEVTFSTSDQDTFFVLPHRFLIPGILVVIGDSLILKEGIDYEIDFRRGEVFFYQPPDSGSSLFITYRRLPVRLQLQYRHWTASDTLLTNENAIPVVSRMKLIQEKKRMDYGGELKRSGSIFRGITVGTNQGMRLQSGLRLQVSGIVAPRVEVVASLTDQNTPIQPEGNTQTLQEIDKVFVNIKAPGFRATLGDYVFDVKGTDFGSYSRKLQGAMGTAEVSFGSVTLSAAASKGEFATNHCMGQEGNQGPYQLAGPRGQREIIVLAGTERVWVDGELMIRGEENDYTIEYGNGQIIFTRNRLITSDSRITVDFEYSDQKFQKGIYGAVGEVKFWEDRVKLRTSFLRESDDKENPLDIPLTDEYKKILENAGDNPDSAVVSGVKYVGENKGSYVKVDTSAIVYYHYVGSDRGDYSVRFSYVGQGKGDYSFRGYGIYRYEGSGKGDYLPVYFLSLAKNRQVTDIFSSVKLGEGIFLEGEIGVSDQDLNQYSSLDDGDNIDLAYSGRFTMEKRHLRFWGKGMGMLGLEGRMRFVGERFRPVGRMTEVEHGRKWGTDEGEYWGESVREIQWNYSPLPFWTLTGDIGTLRRTENFKSERRMINTELSKLRIPTIRYRAELIETERKAGFKGYWLRQGGSVEGTWWGLTPSVSYQGEHRKEDNPDSVLTGFRFDEWTAKLAMVKSFFRGEVGETIRDDRQYRNRALKKNSLAVTDQIRFDIRWGGGLTSSFMYIHRNRDYTDPVAEDQKSDLADVKLRLSPGTRFFDGTVNYRFSSTQVSQMVKDTIRVGEGLGNYRYDENLNEIVPDPDGDILFRTIPTGSFLPVNDLKSGIEARLDGARLWLKKKGILKFLSMWRSRSLVRIERKDREQNFSVVNRSAFCPRWGEDTTIVMGLFSFHQDLECTSPKRGISLRLRYRKDDSENNQLVQEGLIRHVTERSFRAKANPASRFGLLIEYQNRKESKNYKARAWSNRDILSHLWTVEASYRPKQKIEVALKAKVRMAQDLYPYPITEANSFFIVPRFGYSFRGKGHLRAEMEIGDVRSIPWDRTLPYEMLGGDQPGRTLRWTLLLTYKVTGHVMATLNYRGRQEPWRRRLFQTGQVEVRAFF